MKLNDTIHNFKLISIEDVKDNTGNVTPVSSNEYNVVYKTGVSNRRVSIKINSLVSGDIAIIRKNRNGDVSYSIDSYNGPSNDDFGVYVYASDSTAKLDDPKISHNANYVVFDGTNGQFKGTFNITLNASVVA